MKQHVSGYSDMVIKQVGEAVFEVYTPQRNWTGKFVLPDDKQQIYNSTAFVVICKVLAWRWGVIKLNVKHKPISDNCGLICIQVGKSDYELYLPSQIKVAQLRLPPDNNYIDDAECISLICKALALRFRIKF